MAAAELKSYHAATLVNIPKAEQVVVKTDLRKQARLVCLLATTDVVDMTVPSRVSTGITALTPHLCELACFSNLALMESGRVAPMTSGGLGAARVQGKAQ